MPRPPTRTQPVSPLLSLGRNNFSGIVSLLGSVQSTLSTCQTQAKAINAILRACFNADDGDLIECANDLGEADLLVAKDRSTCSKTAQALNRALEAFDGPSPAGVLQTARAITPAITCIGTLLTLPGSDECSLIASRMNAMLEAYHVDGTFLGCQVTTATTSETTSPTTSLTTSPTTTQTTTTTPTTTVLPAVTFTFPGECTEINVAAVTATLTAGDVSIDYDSIAALVVNCVENGRQRLRRGVNGIQAAVTLSSTAGADAMETLVRSGGMVAFIDGGLVSAVLAVDTTTTATSTPTTRYDASIGCEDFGAAGFVLVGLPSAAAGSDCTDHGREMSSAVGLCQSDAERAAFQADAAVKCDSSFGAESVFTVVATANNGFSACDDFVEKLQQATTAFQGYPAAPLRCFGNAIIVPRITTTSTTATSTTTTLPLSASCEAALHDKCFHVEGLGVDSEACVECVDQAALPSFRPCEQEVQRSGSLSAYTRSLVANFCRIGTLQPPPSSSLPCIGKCDGGKPQVAPGKAADAALCAVAVDELVSLLNGFKDNEFTSCAHADNLLL